MSSALSLDQVVTLEVNIHYDSYDQDDDAAPLLLSLSRRYPVDGNPLPLDRLLLYSLAHGTLPSLLPLLHVTNPRLASFSVAGTTIEPGLFFQSFDAPPESDACGHWSWIEKIILNDTDWSDDADASLIPIMESDGRSTGRCIFDDIPIRSLLGERDVTLWYNLPVLADDAEVGAALEDEIDSIRSELFLPFVERVDVRLRVWHPHRPTRQAFKALWGVVSP